MKKSTIIFDLDGTLLDTLADLTDGMNHVLAQNGFPVRTQEEIRSFVGNGIGKLLERAVPGGKSTPAFDRCSREFLEYYPRHCADKTRPYPGIPALLDKLREQGFHIAVVSNKVDTAVKGMCGLFFPGIPALGETPQRRRKPAPDMVLAALEELNVPPESAVFCGDSDVDIATAAACGIPCISVTWGFREEAFLKEAGACLLVHRPEEIPELLNAL